MPTVRALALVSGSFEKFLDKFPDSEIMPLTTNFRYGARSVSFEMAWLYCTLGKVRLLLVCIHRSQFQPLFINY